MKFGVWWLTFVLRSGLRVCGHRLRIISGKPIVRNHLAQQPAQHRIISGGGGMIRISASTQKI